MIILFFHFFCIHLLPTTISVCQAVVALVDGQRPASPWLQTMNTVASAFTGVQPDSGAPSSIWSTITSMFLDGANEGKNANPQQAQSAGGTGGGAVGGIPFSQIWSLLSYSPSSQQLTKDNNNVGSGAPSLADRAISGLMEYILPSLSPVNAFAKRKKPFDAQEIFVDTPAASGSSSASSSASPASSSQSASQQQVSGTSANVVASQSASGSTGAGPGGSFGKPPPTPCPSLEEYISPTFARNYQGAWKYVVQIPHEGYFTQTIQKTSCV